MRSLNLTFMKTKTRNKNTARKICGQHAFIKTFHIWTVPVQDCCLFPILCRSPGLNLTLLYIPRSLFVAAEFI